MTKIAILGTAHGHIFHLADCAKNVAGAQIVGVYDNDEPRLRIAAEKIATPAFNNLEALLATRPALVLIGAVPSDRVDLAERAVAAGAAVLVDKPLALTHAALDRLIAAAEKHRKPIIAYYPYRGYAHVLAAKAALDSGLIGPLVRVMSCGPHKMLPQLRAPWHWTREHNGGALIDIASHHMDICCWFAGQSPAWISALHGNFTRPQDPGFQDFAQAQLRFPGGQFGIVEVDWLNPPSMKNFGDTRMWFLGAAGKIEVRMGDTNSAEYWTQDVAAQPLNTSGYADPDAWTTRLMEQLATGQTPAIPQKEVWRVSRATLYAFESALQNGKAVEPGVGF